MLNLNIKLDSFEGPFELLYHLIEKNEIDIYDIPIAKLADQYIELIKLLPPDMESLSEFLVMAATLLEIKSKMLLPPKKSDTEQEELDPREELVRKLLEYKRFKEITELLKLKEENMGQVVFKDAEENVFSLFEMPKIQAADVLQGVTIDSLLYIFFDVLNRKELKVDKIRVSFNSVSKDTFTVEEKMSHLKGILNTVGKLNFANLFNEKASRSEKIVTFLAVLELIKLKEIKITQENVFDDIIISKFEA